MNCIKNLYLDENLKNIDGIFASMERKESIFNVYLLCVDNSSRNLAEIMSMREAFADRNVGREMTLIGIAYGRRGGYGLFSKIVKEYIEKGFDIKDFKDKILQ